MNSAVPYSIAWRLRTKTLTYTKVPLLMGIVNVTPDSFSDGGKWAFADQAIEHGLRLAAEGADILDIGGESTRPYSTPVEVDEEIRRVEPVIRSLAQQVSIPISIDTSKTQVAWVGIENGAEIINDITGLEGDPKMIEVARASRAGVCVMHMQGTPQTMQDAPQYEDIVAEIFYYLAQRRDALIAEGIEMEHICLDPGIGFGKTHQHNLTLLANYHRFHELGCPLLGGFSRKGFIGKVLGDKDADRSLGNLGVALALSAQRVQVLRVHEIAPIRQALSLFAASGGIDGEPLKLPEER
jgi:dihydropteroate synthase